MKICFIDKTEFSYSYKDLNNSKLRGAESVLINLSSEISKIGHEVAVFNNCSEEYHAKNLSWNNIEKIKQHQNFDVVISNGDSNFFNLKSSKNNILISHSNQSIEQFIRKKQYFSFLKYKPKIWMTSNFQVMKRSFFLRMFGYIMIPWSVDDIFLNSKILEDIDKNQAIFTSRPERNQDMLIDIWLSEIAPRLNDKRLLIYGCKKNILNKNLINKNFVSQNQLLEDLKKSRIYLIPGHKAETFCLSAEEAKELCIPIVTMGLGCLSERVIHNKTGFIAKNKKEFIDYTIQLFSDDDIWKNFRENLLSIRGENSWSKVANSFIQNIK